MVLEENLRDREGEVPVQDLNTKFLIYLMAAKAFLGSFNIVSHLWYRGNDTRSGYIRGHIGVRIVERFDRLLEGKYFK